MTKVAPVRAVSTIMGFWLATSFIGNFVGGYEMGLAFVLHGEERVERSLHERFFQRLNIGWRF